MGDLYVTGSNCPNVYQCLFKIPKERFPYAKSKSLTKTFPFKSSDWGKIVIVQHGESQP